MSRHKDAVWRLSDPAGTWDEVKIAVLMDIRDELKSINRTLGCANFLAIPSELRAIRLNTNRVKRKRKS